MIPEGWAACLSSQARRAAAIGNVEHDMSQDVFYQRLASRACSIARPQQRSTCAARPLRSAAGVAKEPEDTGVHHKVVSAGLGLEQHAVFLSSSMPAWPQHLEGRHRARMMR